ncbi:MAG: hypothetical protein HYV09_35780 [Deltaproteobacteria bacterium]|nr:hypothetical protein [Deltaproteobacteria bacterium]
MKPTTKLEAVQLASLDLVSGSAGLSGGPPHAVIAPVVNLGRASAGFVVIECDLEPSPSPQWSTALEVTVRTGGSSASANTIVASFVLQGAGPMSARDVMKLEPYVQVSARIARAGSNARNLRVRLERA